MITQKHFHVMNNIFPEKPYGMSFIEYAKLKAKSNTKSQHELKAEIDKHQKESASNIKGLIKVVSKNRNPGWRVKKEQLTELLINNIKSNE